MFPALLLKMNISLSLFLSIFVSIALLSLYQAFSMQMFFITHISTLFMNSFQSFTLYVHNAHAVCSKCVKFILKFILHSIFLIHFFCFSWLNKNHTYTAYSLVCFFFLLLHNIHPSFTLQSLFRENIYIL